MQFVFMYVKQDQTFYFFCRHRVSGELSTVKQERVTELNKAGK